MAKPFLALEPSERSVAQSAAYIYAAYIAAARVPEGQEQDWMRRAIGEAFTIARLTDEAIHSETEMG